MVKRLFLVFLFLCLFYPQFTYSSEKIKIHRLTGEIQFDGKPDEPAWQLVEAFPVTMHTPVFRGEITEKTVLKMAYDDQFLWVSGEFFVNDPSHIRATSKKRDEVSGNSDFFGVILDTYNDNENALCFFTTPTGLRTDIAISNDASTENPMNPDWNTFWDVKTTRDEKGWYCEMRIPFSSLRFQPVGKGTTMGLIAWRWSAYNSENVTFPSIDPKYGMWATWKPSLAQKVVFENINPAKPVYISPYVLGGYTNENLLNSDETAYENNKDFTRNIGGDLKYSLTSNLTMDLTVNTDFAQVEADDQQINLTRFSLFFPEKRMFFQERASIFSFNTGGENDLFYSRRIGLDEDGNKVPIYGGARMCGRSGKWDLGFLDMQTAKTDHVVSENFGVLRIRRQVINPNSYVGGIVTSRIGTNGNYNTAYGLDGIFRVFGDDYVDIKFAQTYETGVNSQFASFSPTRIRLNWERRSQKGIGYDLSVSHSGENFNPAMGFEIRDNYRAYHAKVQWGWLPGEKSGLFSHNINVEILNYYNSVSGKLESASLGPGWQFQTKNMFIGVVQFKRMVENVDEAFSFSDDVEVPAGNYEFYGLEAMSVTPMNRMVFAEMMLEGGQFYDGNRLSATVSPYLNLSSSVTINGTYRFDAIDFSGRNQKMNNHIARLKFLYMHSTKLSASTFVQYNTLNAAFVANFRLRYNPREGNDFYLVFNEIRNLVPDLDTPALPSLANRTILLKYTHTFIL